MEKQIKKLGNKIKFMRWFRGMSQKELAEKILKDQSFVAHLELGTRNPSLQTLKKIEKAFKVPSGFLAKATLTVTVE